VGTLQGRRTKFRKKVREAITDDAAPVQDQTGVVRDSEDRVYNSLSEFWKPADPRIVKILEREKKKKEEKKKAHKGKKTSLGEAGDEGEKSEGTVLRTLSQVKVMRGHEIYKISRTRWLQVREVRKKEPGYDPSEWVDPVEEENIAAQRERDESDRATARLLALAESRALANAPKEQEVVWHPRPTLECVPRLLRKDPKVGRPAQGASREDPEGEEEELFSVQPKTLSKKGKVKKRGG